MKLKQWLLGCLNSACKQAAKLALVVLSAWTISVPLSIQTLAISVSVGFLWGIAEYVYNNPFPDDDSVAILKNLPPTTSPETQKIKLTDKIDS